MNKVRKTKKPFWTRKVILITAFCTLCVAGLIIGLVLGLKKKKDGPSSGPSGGGGHSPDSSPPPGLLQPGSAGHNRKSFNQKTIRTGLDYGAINNNKHLNKYLITDSEIVLNDFIKLKSINDIDSKKIKESLFFIYFETDDQYLPHLDKIVKEGGKFIIHMDYAKNNYVNSNKNCKLALLDTTNTPCPSHYNESIHQNICQAIEQTKHLDGDYVEIGVYKGGSALTALNYLKHSNIQRKSYLFDTFDGFDYDEATNSVDAHWTGTHKLWGVDKTMQNIQNLLESKCPNQHFELIKSNICKDSLPDNIEKIVVANIDVDMLEATRDALNKVDKKMVKGGIIICEDPTSTPALIGAFYAMEKFLETSEGKNYMKLHLVGQYFLIKLN